MKIPIFGKALVSRKDSMNSFLPGYLKRARENAAGIQMTIEQIVVMIATRKDCTIEDFRLFCWKMKSHQ